MAQSNPPMKSYADYACPFCYLEQQSLSEYCQSQAEHPAVDWHPYDIRQQKRTTDGSLDGSADIGYPDDVHNKIARLVREHDANEMLPLSDVPLVDSLPAQTVSWRVKQEYPDHWFSFSDRLFTALWRDGRDISDVEILSTLAAESGLREDTIENVATSPTAREQVLGLFSDARNDGIDDVPTLIYDDRTLREVVSSNELREFVHER